MFSFRRHFSRPQSMPTYCLMHTLHKLESVRRNHKLLRCRLQKSGCMSHHFLQIYTHKLYEEKRLSGLKKQLCIQYLDREDKESLQHLKHQSFSCDAAWKLWKHWNMVIDFILFCWTWSTQTELENKSASSIDLKASWISNPSLKGHPWMWTVRSQRRPVRSALQTLSDSTERGFLDWTSRWKLSSIDRR